MSDCVGPLAALVEREVVDVHRDLRLRKDLLGGGVAEEEEAVGVAAGAEQPVAARVEFELLDEALAVALKARRAACPCASRRPRPAACCRGGRCCRSCRCRRRRAAPRRARTPGRGCRRSSAAAGPGPRCRTPAPRASASRLAGLKLPDVDVADLVAGGQEAAVRGRSRRRRASRGSDAGSFRRGREARGSSRPEAASQSRQTMSSATLATNGAVGRGRDAANPLAMGIDGRGPSSPTRCPTRSAGRRKPPTPGVVPASARPVT